MKTRFFKRGASLLVAAAMLSGIMPCTLSEAVVLSASAYIPTVKFFSTWYQLYNLINNAPTNESVKYMASDNAPDTITAQATDECIIIPEDTIIEIDLNGKTLSRGLSRAETDGLVFENYGSLTINNGSITGGCNSENGGGILNFGDLTLESSSSIYGCRSEGNGGGIYNCVDAVLYVFGATIEGGEAVDGGGIYNEGELEMVVGSQTVPCLSGNTATNNGGGLYNCGLAEAYLCGARVQSNHSRYYGGAIFNAGKLELDYYAADDEDSSSYYTDISSNYAGFTGGGIYNNYDPYNSNNIGRIEFASFAAVSNNTSNFTLPDADEPYYNNIFLQKGQKIYITGEFPDDIPTKTGITVSFDHGDEIAGYVFTENFGTYSELYEPYECFETDSALKDWIVGYDIDTDEACFKKDLWKELQKTIDGIADGSITNEPIVLEDNVVCFNDTNLTIPSGADITIDLHGYSIDRNRGNAINTWGTNGCVIRNDGTLTILDSTDQWGSVTGGFSGSSNEYVAGGVYNTGIFNFRSGVITGNCVCGDYTGCSAVYNAEDEDYDENGNVYSIPVATFNLSGGVIADNSSYSDYALFAVNGANVSGNPKVYDNFRYYSEVTDTYWNPETGEYETEFKPRAQIAHNIRGNVNVVGQLTDGAEIGIEAVSGVRTSSYAAYGNWEDPSTFFKSDDDRYSVVWSSDQTEVAMKPKSAAVDGAQLILNEDIGVRFRTGLGTNDHLLFILTWGNGKSAYSRTEVYFENDRKYYGYAALPMAPKYLSDEITYKAYSFDSVTYDNTTDTYTANDGAQPLMQGTYSVKNDYIKPVFEDANLSPDQRQYTAADRQMLSAIVNYAKAAQVLFSYNLNDPIDQYVNNNETVTVTYTPSGNVSFDNLARSSYYYIPEDNSNDPNREFTYYGTSMILEDKPRMRHYFWVKDPSVPPVARHALNQYDFDTLTQIDPTSHYCYYDGKVSEPTTYDYERPIEVFDDTAERWVKVNMTVNDLIYMANQSSDVDQKTKDALKALYFYGEEAKIYR